MANLYTIRFASYKDIYIIVIMRGLVLRICNCLPHLHVLFYINIIYQAITYGSDQGQTSKIAYFRAEKQKISNLITVLGAKIETLIGKKREIITNATQKQTHLICI